MKLFKLFKRGQKGVTLVELMVVMAILAVLASIIFPAVSGTKETSTNSQVKTDAGVIEPAINSYYADQEGAAVITNDTTNILSTTSNQTTNTRYPENYLTIGYPDEFPPTAVNVTDVTITTANNAVLDSWDLAEGWNAIDMDELFSLKYIPSVPGSASDSAVSNGVFHNYLWLVRKTTTASEGGATVDSRKVEVFRLQKVVKSDSKYQLFYEQIY